MYIKKIFDFALSLIAIILFSPLFVIIYLLIRVKMSNPVLFKQKRPGLNEKLFELYKFRTMTEKRDKKGDLLSDKDRITTFGKFLRKTSLDELPGLFNIIKGDMSFVGPRPLLIEYLPLYNEEQKKRHLVKPGLTGWAQINGRNAITWEQKFEYDVWYIENWSLCLDIKILLLTLVKVIRREGINQKNQVTMEKFKGENNK